MGKDGSVVMHLTGAELQAIERHTGHLPRVANDDTGALVRVPAEYVDAARGAEEVSGTSVASVTYNRGIGHAEQAQEALSEADDKDSTTGDEPDNEDDGA